MYVTKICPKCGGEKPISEFRKHSRPCKECSKAIRRARYREKTKDPNFVESERARGREKYHRLGYASSGAAKKKHEKYKCLRNARRDFSYHLKDYVELHHWNYNCLNQVICLDKRLHRRAHMLMDFDLEHGYYFFNGNPLDTIEKHLEVIKLVCERDGFDYSHVKVLTK